MQHEFSLQEEDGMPRRPVLGRRRNWAYGGQSEDAADQADLAGAMENEADIEPDIPPLPPGVPPLTIGPDDGATAHVRRRSVLRPMLFIGTVLAVAVGAGMWIFGEGVADQQGGEVPLILAEEGPEKVRPAEEGGLEVPNQNVLIYEQLDGQQQSPVTELLLPEPEAPLEPPPPPEIQFGADNAVAPPAPSDSSSEATDEAMLTTAMEEDVDIPIVAAPSLEVAPAAGTEEQAPAVEASEPAAADEPTVETASVAGAFRVQLAAVKSEDAARSAWKKLAKLHGDQLGDLSLRVEPVDRGAEGMLYRIQAGPISDRTSAQEVCAQLKKKDQPCLVVAP